MEENARVAPLLGGGSGEYEDSLAWFPVWFGSMAEEVSWRVGRQEAGRKTCKIGENSLKCTKGVFEELEASQTRVCNPQKIIAALMVQPSFRSYPWSILTPEQSLQLRFWIHQTGDINLQVIVFNVLETYLLPSEVDIHEFELRSKRTEGFCFRLEYGQSQRLFDSVHQKPAWLRESMIIGMQLPCAFATLIASKKWSSFCLPLFSPASDRGEAVRVRRRKVGLPTRLDLVGFSDDDICFDPVAERELQQHRRHADVENSLANSRKMLAFIDSITHFAPHPRQDQSDEAKLVRSWITRLQLHAFELDLSRRESDFLATKTRFSKFKLLVEAVMLHQHIRGGMSEVIDAMRYAFRIFLPQTQAAELCAQLDQQNHRFPSKSYISKLRGAVDAGMMGYMSVQYKKWFRECNGVSIYPMIDSSPQGGRNNELGVATLVPNTNLQQLFRVKVIMDARPRLF
jgi:hypothetical protein